MDLRQLRYFIAVFEHGSFSRAAAEIPLSQPALTRSIQALENELDVKLFQREPRGIIPTSAGERFYRHAYKILGACDRAEVDVRSAGDYLSGGIAIGVAAMFTHTIMERVIAEFFARHPKVKITVCEGLLGDLLSGLERGDFDLALCNLPVQPLPNIHAIETLLELNSHVYASRDHPLAHAGDVSWKSAAEVNWVNFNQSHSLEAFDAIFLNQNLAPPQNPVLTNSLSLIKSLILNRGFIGMLPQQVVANEMAEGAIVCIPLPGMPVIRKAGLLSSRDANRNPLSELLAEELRVVCQELSVAL